MSYEEKCKIVREYQESNLTLYQFSAKYDISNSTISAWVKLAEREGYEALDSHKSRHSKTGKRMVKRLPVTACLAPCDAFETYFGGKWDTYLEFY